jgi:hypothetical protein
MGNCGSLYTLNYCQKVDGEPLNADPDIVGPGVSLSPPSVGGIEFTEHYRSWLDLP